VQSAAKKHEFDGLKPAAEIGTCHHFSGILPRRLKRLRFWKNALDSLSRSTPRRRNEEVGVPRRIGVLLQWGIGDAVLAQPLLRALSQRYPDSSIEVIGKPWLANLFAGESCISATHELVPPWTKPKAKYEVWTGEWRRYVKTLLAIRKIRFDLVLGTRFDPREALQLRMLNATRVAGVLGAGGAAWITDPISLTAEDYYFRYRGEYNAIAVRELTGSHYAYHYRPQLSISNDARARALNLLERSGYVGGLILGIHNGAGNPVRKWRAGGFIEVIKSVQDLVKFVVIIDDGTDPAGPGIDMPHSIASMVWKTGIVELKALLSITDVLLCCDSGVMHIGAACGCRIVAIFGPTSSDVFFPQGEGHQLVKVEPMPCRPCLDSCIYPRPICMDRITVSSVTRALRSTLSAGRVPSSFHAAPF
jgi:heptosyltransferase-2